MLKEDYNDMSKLILEEAKELQDELVSYRRHLHENPEIGMDIPETAAFVKEKLEEMGYEAQYVSNTGVTALAGGKKPGKVILLRADMDALPIQEEAGVSFKSCNNYMHACGHDLHTAMLLGAAKLLKNKEDELEGTVKFMFQPAEETLAGAKQMVQDGILENPNVDMAVMFHVMPGVPLPSGTILVPESGTFTSSSDSFELVIKGKGGHGAMPETAVDPLLVASHIHLALQEIRSRELSSGENAVLTVSQIQGGNSYNIIPDTVMMKGTIRTFNDQTRQYIPKRIEEIAKGVANAFRAEASFTLIEGCPSVVNDEAVINDVRKILTDAFGPRTVPGLEILGEQKMNGSEDFSYISQRVPSAMLIIGAGSQEEGYPYTVHHPKVTFNEDILSQGAAAFALIALHWLRKNNHLEKVDG